MKELEGFSRGWDSERVRPAGRGLLGAAARVVFAALALVLGFGSGAADLRAQCGAAKPTGATLVTQGSGIFLAPGPGKQNFSPYALNLANYSSGGLLTIQIALGNGASAATFDLFAGNAVISAGTTTAQPLASQTNVAPGACTTLTYKFSQAGSYILAVTGSNSAANSLNTFQYTAYVQPTLAGAVPTQPATAPATPTTPPAQPAPATPVIPAGAQPGQPTSTPYRPPSRPPGQPAGTQPAQPGSAPTPQPAAPQPAQPAPSSTPQSATPQPAQPAAPPAAPPAFPPAPTNPSLPGPTGPLLIQQVSIQNSPGVPDTGGHCIICGLVTGNLKAVEPNLLVCITPVAATGSHGACTPTCKNSHDCTQSFRTPGVLLDGTNRAVHVTVMDDDGEGKVQQLSAFDESDPTICTSTNPCPVDDPAGGDPMLVSFTMGTCGISAPMSATDQPAVFTGANQPRVLNTPAAVSPLADPLSHPVDMVEAIISSLGEPLFTSTPDMGNLTFAPTSATQIYPSSMVEVQTAMTGTQGARKCDDGGPRHETCNGITVHANANIPNARFAQFFYREAYDNSNHLVAKILNGDPGCKPDITIPQRCYPTSVTTKNWITDTATAPSPYYTSTNTITDCNGSTMFDSPTFLDTLGNTISKWVFHGKDFVISNGSVVASVDWTLEHNASDPQFYTGTYTSVTISILQPPLSQLPAPFPTVLQKASIRNPLGPNAAQ